MYCLGENKWAWQLVESAKPILVFPKFSEPEVAATEGIVASLLGKGHLDRIVLIEGSATLAAQDLKVEWTKDDLEWFCRLVSQEVLKGKPEARKYVTKLLSRFTQIATSNPQIWHELPIYEVASIVGTSSVVSAKSLQAHASANSLFSNGEAGLKNSFRYACPAASAWFVVGSAPPGISALAFDTSAVAALVLLQASLGGAQNRIALIAKLLADMEKLKSAIRYLIHGSADHREDTGNLFMRVSGNDSASKWNEVFKVFLEHRSESWRLVDATFATGINDQQKETLNLKICGADSFRGLWKSDETRVADLPLAPYHDFLLTQLNEGTHYDSEADNKLLRSLKIHCYGKDLFTTIEDSVWLAPEAGKEPSKDLKLIWDKLCQNARIVQRSSKDEVVLRQSQLFKNRILDPNGIIRLACQQGEPHGFAKLILHYLASIGNPAKETSDALKKAAWLPLANGRTTTLGNLLWLDGAEEALGKLVCHRAETSTIVTRGEIQLGLAEKAGAWNTLSAHLIPKGDDAIKLLRTALADNPTLHFGLSTLSSSQVVSDWLKAVEGCEIDISPAVALIRALWPTEQGHDIVPKQTWAGKVAAVFAKGWTGDDATRYDTVLKALRDRHRKVDSDKRAIIIGVFYSYLSAAVHEGRWDAFKLEDDFQLLNQNAEWKPLSELVRPCSGIVREFQVHKDAAKTLALPVERAGEADAPIEVEVAQSDEETALMLADFGALLPQLHKKQWGAFVTLLGDDPEIRSLADRLTEDTEGFRSGLISKDDVLRIIGSKHFRCSQIDGETVEMDSLNGEVLNVPIDSEANSFLVPDRNGNLVSWEISNGLHIHRIRLLSANRFLKLDANTLQRRLEHSIAEILRSAFDCHPEGVGEFLDKVIEVQERSLGVAQQTILLGAELHLQQLGWRQEPSPELEQALRLLDDSKGAEALAREQERVGHARSIEIKKNRDKANDLRNQGLRLLEEIFKDNTGVQSRLSEAMSRKISEQGYKPDSVPFELFQNADDALSEREDENDIPAIFVADFTGRTVRFAHWGRPINDPADADDLTAESYRHDLVKMILLNGSDKRFEAVQVTGKFGLGFKSVFLICQTPRIVSRSLAFEVLGATYPRRLHTDDEYPLRQWIESQCANRRDGTAFELSLRAGSAPIHGTFSKLASYLPVFARRIREIRVLGNDPATFHWQPKRVPANEAWELWLGDAGAAGRLMQLKCCNVSWLFGLDQVGIRKLNGLPCIWATAPLHSTGEVGFALNGPFEPDPGRTELGKGEAAERRNSELFLEASRGLAKFLEWFAKHGDVRAALGLEITSDLSFWQSVWAIFSALPTSDKNLTGLSRVSQCVWSKDGGGYAGVAKNFPIIPNELPGTLGSLTSINQVRYATSGYLESKAGKALLSAMAKWNEWLNMEPELLVTAGNIVSASVGSELRRRISDFSIEQFSVPFLLRRLVGKSLNVTAALCVKLSAHLNSNLWRATDDRNSAYDWPRPEKESFEDFLGELRFQNELCGWVNPTTLLIRSGTGIEACRAAFAPQERLLHPGYSLEALEFFRLCRGEMKVTVGELADWIEQSLRGNDEVRIIAMLMFLASDDRIAEEVAQLSSEECKASILITTQFQSLQPVQKQRIEKLFDIAKLRNERDGPFEQPHPPLEPEHTRPLSLDDVVQAWRGNEAHAIHQFTVSGIYRDLVFPDVEEDADLGALLRDTSSIEGKEHWYRLLCLGCSMSIRLGQNPAARIIPFWRNRLNADFWASTIPATLEDAKSSGYDQRLDAFFEDIIHQTFRNENASGEDADFWRRVFYDFRKMHFYVFKNDLPAVLLQLAKSNDVEGSALISFLRSGLIPVAMQTPGMETWAGVIGQSMSAPLLFVMRELRRLNVLPPDRFDKACFYMNSPARRVAYRLGWISDDERRDYSLGNLVSLSEHMFNTINDSEYADSLLPHFDLPLQSYAHNNR